ncbi:MAG: flagellar FlbD family protein [Lachnospiraceae bacterium]|nr:flagellar FlbD family protein [Lachnospiraceae bacterium]
MIEVTKLNGTKFMINIDLIGIVEETPDTVITLNDGKKYIVKESAQEIKDLIKTTRQEYFQPLHRNP